MTLPIEIDFFKVTKERLSKCDGWWWISNNYKKKEVFSCREAVQYRDRLGSGENGGVPLWSELKSQIYEVSYPNMEFFLYIVCHTRANTQFIDDYEIIKAANLDPISATICRMNDTDSEELGEEKQSDSPFFGLVNPFNIELILEHFKKKYEQSNIIQIFDCSLLKFAGFPETVITNAGDRSKFMEIHPTELVNTVKKFYSATKVAQISSPDPIWYGEGKKHIKTKIAKRVECLRFPPSTGPKIGIVTGNSPESGLTLWNDFLANFRFLYNNLADILMPEVIIHSFPQMGLSMELVKREDQVWEAMKSSILGLLESGCNFITIACNTTIYFESKIVQLCKRYNSRFISIAEACIPEIKYQILKSNNPRVGLVGIGTVIDISGGYSGYKSHFQENGIEVIPCNAEALAYDIKNIGTSKKEINSIVEKFRNLVRHKLKSESVIVLSLTEVSLIYREHKETLSKKYKETKIFIDPLMELSRYLVYLYLLQGYQNSNVFQILLNIDLETSLKELIYSDHYQ